MHLVFRIQGLFLMWIAAAMLVPLGAEIYAHTNHWEEFAIASLCTMFFAGILYISNQEKKSHNITVRETFIMTVSLWLIIPFFACLPFMLIESDSSLSFTDAFFESVSGLTTTGATVMNGLDSSPPGILLWRSILQWLGGVGIVVISMAIFPALGIGGMQLFRSESSDKSDKVLPKTRKIAIATISVYSLLTVLCIISYYIAGMESFDALNHALTTISTAGFSTHDSSISYFDSPRIEITATIFMLIGGVPLLLYFSLMIGKAPNSVLLSQTKVYFGFVLIAVILISLFLVYVGYYDIASSFRYVSFNMVSIITTTGYASDDYGSWPYITILLYLIGIVGGCSGSTSGGMKIFRFQILWKSIQERVGHLISPNEISTIKVGGSKVGADVITSINLFIILFTFSFCIVMLLLSMTGIDFLTSMSAAASTLANLGPGLGEIIGPTGNFSSLPDVAKWILAFSMIMGRLEFLTLFAMLSISFWR